MTFQKRPAIIAGFVVSIIGSAAVAHADRVVVAGSGYPEGKAPSGCVQESYGRLSTNCGSLMPPATQVVVIPLMNDSNKSTVDIEFWGNGSSGDGSSSGNATICEPFWIGTDEAVHHGTPESTSFDNTVSHVTLSLGVGAANTGIGLHCNLGAADTNPASGGRVSLVKYTP